MFKKKKVAKVLMQKVEREGEVIDLFNKEIASNLTLLNEILDSKTGKNKS